MSNLILHFGFGALILLAAGYGIYRYRTPLNPLTFFAVIDVGVFIFFAGIGAQFFQAIQPYGPDAVTYTLWISMVFFMGGVIPYFLKIDRFQAPYKLLFHKLKLDSTRIPGRFSPLLFLIFFGLTLTFFAILAVFGGGGLLWITDTRSAYLSYRVGVGGVWLLMQWCLSTATLYLFWTLRPRGIKLVVSLAIACFVAFFTGSKGSILMMLVLSIAYYQFYVKKINFLVICFLFVGLSMAIFGLMILQGSYGTLIESLSYFGGGGYFDTTAQIIDRWNEFSFQYGYAYLSSLWFYVPRSIYPGKPWEYGALLFYGTLYPGAAALGNTPGYLVWTLDYMNFGIIGVFFGGFARSLFQKIIYSYFLKNKNQFFAFLFAIQFSLYPILYSMSFAFTLLWSMGIFILAKSLKRNIRTI